MAGARERVIDQLRHFDEEAFVALANRGLLRRAEKDLKTQAATIEEETAEVFVMRFGEQRITFDRRGPAHAKCSCPAAGVCQHILAVALSLQRSAASAAPAGGSSAPPVASASPTPDAAAAVPTITALHDALMALSPNELVRHAGKAGYRWAWQFVTDLDAEEGVEFVGDRNIVIGFRQPRIRLRYMGGGPESLIADVEVKSLEKYQVAAVLAYRRAHGAAIAAPEPTAKAKTAALDLGKDHALAEGGQEVRRASRLRLRTSVQQLLKECMELGLSHLSSAIQERFSTLAVWAQGAEYYRLALLLRRIADHVELMLERAGAADEHRLFDELTIARALVEALASAEARGVAAPLAGRSRSAYEETAQLELIGLGASAWRSASGYVGLTMMFFSPAGQCFHSCTDARPELQRGFDPRARYKSAGPWSGLAAPEAATGRRVLLVKPQVNAQGRLSAAESTSAVVQQIADVPARLAPIDSWSALAQHRKQLRRSVLSEPQPMLDWVILRPARFGTPRFDAVRQILSWPLFDAEDEPLMAELVFSPFTEHAIQRIEQLTAAELSAGTLVVARVHRGATGLVAEPLSLIGSRADRPVDALHFDPAPKQGFRSKWLDKLQWGASPERPDIAMTAGATIPVQLRELGDELRRQAERGIAVAAAHQDGSVLREFVSRCTDIGLSGFASANAAEPAQADHLLTANYVRLQYLRLLDDSEVGDD
jgi:hypothetical protein